MDVLLADNWWRSQGLTQHPVGVALALSGLYDLTPLRLIQVNEWMRFSETDIKNFSPLWHIPKASQARLIASVGTKTNEFARQSKVYFNAWQQVGYQAKWVDGAAFNHFSLARDLTRPDSELVDAVCDAISQNSSKDLAANLTVKG